MKNKTVSSIWPSLIFCIVILGCSDRYKLTISETVTVPVYLSMGDFRAGFAVEEPKSLKVPGKIYVYENLLFINESFDGIHIVDNSNPMLPVFLKYLRLPGCSDITVINNVLMANSGPDLLSISISNLNEIKLLNREENIFFNQNFVFDGKYLVGYMEKEQVQTEYGRRGWNYGFSGGMEDYSGISTAKNSGFNNSGSNTTGIAGSTARFAIAGNYLYVVDNTSLIPVDISDPLSPKSKASVNLNRGTIETIFKYKGYLYIGSTDGVFIYDYALNPISPAFVSLVEHARRCDPVVVDNDIAFSTLRTGSRCGGGQNELLVIDVKNPKSPKLLKSYFFIESPNGLSIDGKTLFICFGAGGIKQYDISDLNNITNSQLASDPSINATDIILNNGVAIVTGETGIVQYSYEAGGELVRLSTLFAR